MCRMRRTGSFCVCVFCQKVTGRRGLVFGLDLLSFCFVSPWCEVMRCEPRVWVRFLCCANLFFCVFLCVSVFYEFMCIAFSRLPVSPCVCVCVCASVSVRLAEVDEKARVWPASHCGCCSVYTSLWLGRCVKLGLHLWHHKHTLSAAAFLSTWLPTAGNQSLKKLEWIELIKQQRITDLLFDSSCKETKICLLWGNGFSPSPHCDPQTAEPPGEVDLRSYHQRFGRWWVRSSE